MPVDGMTPQLSVGMAQADSKYFVKARGSSFQSVQPPREPGPSSYLMAAQRAINPTGELLVPQTRAMLLLQINTSTPPAKTQYINKEQRT